MSRTFTIGLRDLRIFGRHGVFESERRDGNDFRVDISITLRAQMPIGNDLDRSVSYALLYEIVASEMAIPSPLLEDVAERIAASVKQRFPHIAAGHVEIVKTRPPIPGCNGEAYVALDF